MMDFDCYVGVDYSGAATPQSGLHGLQVYCADTEGPVRKVSPASDDGSRNRPWSREGIANWLLELAASQQRFLAGIDHCFSLTIGYFRRYGLGSWDQFLEDFVTHWPAHLPGMSLEHLLRSEPKRLGHPEEMRITDLWTQGAKSPFHFRGIGAVGKASFTGIPWLHVIREQAGNKVFFWPFDGFQLPGDRSVIVEAYPALYKRRYPGHNMTSHQHDAYSIAAWLRDMDQRDALQRYGHPPLTPEEKRLAQLEGWILGVG